MTTEDHFLLAEWAAACARHILPVFEQENPHDDRVHKAIEAAALWTKGLLKMTDARQLAFAAHAAARETTSLKAKAAARAAGHAAATTHVYTHAKYAAQYAQKAAENRETEKDWQLEKLRQHLHVYISKI